ncbi:MAG: hypothetical protein AAB473_03450 [Patescibacteria group bacterium]
MTEVVKPERVYEEQVRRDGCRFCQQSWRDNALASYGGWIAVPNERPRTDALFIQPLYQILFTPIDHSTERITAAGFAAFVHLRDELIERFGLKGYGICIREGDRLYSGQIMQHPHIHMIVPQIVTLSDGSLHASTFNFPIGDRDAPKV